MSATKESSAITEPNLNEASSCLESVVINGDLSKLSSKDRVIYYNKVCESLGLNPFTRPFDYITLNGKLTLYARREATEQLRKIHNISIKISNREIIEDVYTVTSQATTPAGRSDESIGAVSVAGLRGETKANAMMKCETKAKRRVTLSICGLSLLDEIEVATVADARFEKVDLETGEIFSAKNMASKSQINKLKDLVEMCPHPIELIKSEFKKMGATCYGDMTEECAKKMIKWLGCEFDIEACKFEDERNEIQQGSKVA